MRRLGRLFVALAMTLVVPACSSDSDVDEMATDATNSKSTPGDDSIEAGFARDMSNHHAQAVAMAEAIRDRTEDPGLRLLATDIALGQQNQIGRMTGWLDEWSLSIGTTNQQMAWMSGDVDEMDGMDMGTNASMPGSIHLDPDTGLMPGMATRPQVTALRDLPVADAEVSFLHLMISHHLGGVEMAEAALGLTDHPSVIRLASSMVASQQAEIAVMTEMLAKRGVTS